MTKDGKFEAWDIANLLNNKFDKSREWVTAMEVSNTTGFAMRRVDYIAANCYQSNGYGIHAFEIKISKSDLRRELECPTKHTIFFDDIDTYSIVAPIYVLDAEYRKLIPKKWGIYVADILESVDDDGNVTRTPTLHTYRKPLALHDDKDRDRRLKRGFVMSMIRAMMNQDGKMLAPPTVLKKQYDDGYKCGREDGERSAGNWKKMYLEDHWARELANKFHVYSEESYKKKLPQIEMIGLLLDETLWFNSRIEDVLKSADKLKKAFENLLKGGAKC